MKAAVAAVVLLQAVSLLVRPLPLLKPMSRRLEHLLLDGFDGGGLRVFGVLRRVEHLLRCAKRKHMVSARHRQQTASMRRTQ